MVIEEFVNRFKAELDAQLARLGLGGLVYETWNWKDRLFITFSREAGEKFNDKLTAVSKSLFSAFRKDLISKGCDYGINEPEEDDWDDEDGLDEGNPPEDEDEIPPEIAAALAALPRYPLDELWEKIDETYIPLLEIRVKEQYTVVSEEEAACDLRDQEETRLEALAEAMVHGQDGGETADEAFEWIPIPPPPKKLNSEVYLTLAYEPYDAIERGEKKTEFREYRPYYVKKLLSQHLKTVRFQRGYGGPGHDVPRQMTWTISGIEYYDIYSRECAPIANPPKDFRPTHIAIDLGERLS